MQAVVAVQSVDQQEYSKVCEAAGPTPVPLEDVVNRATEVSYHIEYEARGLQKIGQPLVTSLNPYTILMKETTGSI